MKQFVRIFTPDSLYSEQELHGTNIPIPRVGEIVYFYDMPYMVSNVDYSYNEVGVDECNIDITTKHVPKEWWDEINKTLNDLESSKDKSCTDTKRREESTDTDFDSFTKIMDELDRLSEKLYTKFNIKISYGGGNK